MGLLAPAAPALDREIVGPHNDDLLDGVSPEAARATSRRARQSVSQLEWLEHMLHPWSSLLIVPVFPLANAGVALGGDASVPHSART
jgi:Na+:H+ antiporter, NhaA family